VGWLTFFEMTDEGVIHVCSKCRNEYNDAFQENNVTSFKTLPDSWECPQCPNKFKLEYENIKPEDKTRKNAYYEKVNKDLAKEAFHYFDIKGDGKLEPKEFKQALQASGLSPSQKEFDSILVETGSLVSYMAYMKAVEQLGDKILTEYTFIQGFEPLVEDASGNGGKSEGKCIHRDLLEHICDNYQPPPAKNKDQEPDKMSSSEIQQVLALAEKCMVKKSGDNKGDKEILVNKFAHTMMTGEAN